MSHPLIFDTSVWIDFLNNKDTPTASLLEHYISLDEQVVLTPTILQEILQGIRDDARYRQVKCINSSAMQQYVRPKPVTGTDAIFIR